MKAIRYVVAGSLLALASLPACAGLDNWVNQCQRENPRAWCEQQGRKLATTSRAEAAAAFNINSGFSKLFAGEFGTVTPGTRLRPGAVPPRPTADLAVVDRERVRTPEGLRLYLGERAGKGNARVDFLYAGASKGAERAQWMQRAALAGNADAMYVLGYMHANGLDGQRRDDGLALHWFTKAAQAGSAAAMGEQARMLAARGDDGQAEALRLAGEACERNAQSACIVLADLSLAASDMAEITPEEREKLVARALQLYGGVLIRDSRGFTLEPERQSALYALARLYLDGRYLPPNKVEARDDLVRALNVDGAMLTDAWMTFADEMVAGPDGAYGFPRDAARGLEILRRFADMGDVGATLALGTLLLGGKEGVPADPMAARALLKRAAGEGDAVAATVLATHYADDKNEAEAFRWVQQAMAAGNPRAYYLAAFHHLDGRGTDQDARAFRGALQKSCDLGYTRACLELGNRLVQGADGFGADPQAGAVQLEKARRDGSAEASFALGTLRLRTAGVDDEARIQDAVGLILEAGKRGSPEAEEFLARIAAGDNAALKTALARARGERVTDPALQHAEAMRAIEQAGAR